jgi:hypothetical protein
MEGMPQHSTILSLPHCPPLPVVQTNPILDGPGAERDVSVNEQSQFA